MDCCETQYMDTFLTITSAIIETVVNKCANFHVYFMAYLKYTLSWLQDMQDSLFAECY